MNVHAVMFDTKIEIILSLSYENRIYLSQLLSRVVQ